MSPEHPNPKDDAFISLRRNLLFTREFDISDTNRQVFSGLDGESEGLIYEIGNKGFTLSSLKSYQEEHDIDEVQYDTAYEYMFDIAAKYRGPEQNWVDHVGGAETKLPLELLMATRLLVETSPPPTDTEQLEFIDGYFASIILEHQSARLMAEEIIKNNIFDGAEV